MKRILLKLSGEALAGAKKTGFDEETVIAVSRQIRTIAEEGTQVGIVIGGGNFWRGRTSETINRNKADQIGMLATVMNCMFLISADIWDLKQKFLLRLYAEHLRNCIPRMQWRKRLRQERSCSLQAEPDILIFPQTRQLCCVQ